jgi:hypothetical protein
MAKEKKNLKLQLLKHSILVMGSGSQSVGQYPYFPLVTWWEIDSPWFV